MVDPSSACLFWKDELIVPVHANHSLIAKLTRSIGSAYFIIRAKLKEVVEFLRLDVKKIPQSCSGFRSNQIRIIGSLQTACIKAYRLLSTSEVIHKNALLLIERCRFEVWQTEFFGQLTSHSNPTHLGLILRVLESKGLIMGDLCTLKEKYGFCFQLSCPSRPLDTQPTQLVTMTDPSDPSWLENSTNFLREIHEALDAAKFLNPTVSDPLRYKTFVHKLRHLNDTLILLLPRQDAAAFEQAVITALIANKDIATLKAVERDARCQEDLTAISRAASTRLWTIEVRQMSGEFASVQTNLKLPKSTLKFRGNTGDLYKSRTSAIYMPENGTPTHVLVEWKYHTDTEDDFDNMPIHWDIESVVGLLYKTPQPKGFRVLTCLGYIEDDGRFGIVYKKPEIADQQLHPVSLSDLLADDDNDHVPDLGDRFQLAYTLANSINEFHSMGWLHKNINSYNILFFRTRASSAASISGIDISSPFIAGFDFSRHIMARTTPPTITKAYELYCHPSYLREGSFASGFRRKYDIYSLGLVLFEIGVWKKLDDFNVPEGPRESLPSQIESEYIQWLGPSMGSTYRAAVMACLKGTYWPLPDDSQSLEELSEFRTRVLWELGRCSA
jgi:hypothetical protein